MKRITMIVITVALIVAFVVAPVASYNGWQDPDHNFNPQHRNGTVNHTTNHERPNCPGYGNATPNEGIGCPWLETHG